MSIKNAIAGNNRDKFVEVCNERYLSDLEIRKRIPRIWDTADILIKVHKWRRLHGITTTLLNQDGQNFWFCLTPKVLEAHDYIGKQNALFENIPEKTTKRLKQDNLLEEAFFSSQIEGAKTTRRRAEEIIRHGAKPRDKSEQETLNNYQAMEYIIAHQEKEITVEMIKELHRIVTNKALSYGKPGEFRTKEDDTVVGDRFETVYIPPPADKAVILLEELLEWVNKKANIYAESSIHPIAQAAIIHFYLVYLHPFPDGNGRAARALYYFYLNQYYNAMPFISISHVIGKKRKAYDKAILDVEEHGTDLTFFIHYSCDITKEAIDNLRLMVDRYSTADRLDELLGEKRLELNKRQISLLKYMLRPDVNRIYLKWYQKRYRVVYETARSDLLSLQDLGVLKQTKIGKKFVYELIKGVSHGG